MTPDAMRSALLSDWTPWLLGVLVLVLGAATLEGLVQTLRRPGSYDWRAYFASVADALLRRATDGLGLSLAAPLVAMAYEHRLSSLALDGPLPLLALFLLLELSYYGYHRAAHRVRWFWASHAVHHTPNQLTLATALRLGVTSKMSGTALFFAPLVWLGFPPLAVFGMLAFNLLYQFWLHAPWMPRLPAPLEWLLNTPAHHRVHHASNAQYLDCNYGGVLIVYDRLFGSFRAQQPGDVLRYGLTEPLFSHNPLRIALHEWLRLARDLRATRGWKARLRVLLGPPVALAVVLAAAPAHAGSWSGSLGLTSDRIERGLSQSDRNPSWDASVGWRSEPGFYVKLGAAGTRRNQYPGSDGYRLLPEAGWSADLDAAGDWRAGLALKAQVFPGAQAPRATGGGSYGTTEFAASLGWRVATLSLSRSFGDYLGLRERRSRGTTYVALDFELPLNDRFALVAGAGRLQVPDQDRYAYADWRLGLDAKLGATTLSLLASGSSADRRAWQQAGDGATVVAAVKWRF
jgi:sterol desaturase/sphingolipid hydroxylase (fatty acid hydroxylase superfamily)